MNLHNNKELNDLFDISAVKHRTRHPLPMLCPTVPYPNGSSETTYPGSSKDYWHACPPTTTYEDPIYDGNYSNRDILHPFITSEPLHSTSRTSANDLAYSEKLDEKARRSANEIDLEQLC